MWSMVVALTPCRAKLRLAAARIGARRKLLKTADLVGGLTDLLVITLTERSFESTSLTCQPSAVCQGYFRPILRASPESVRRRLAWRRCGAALKNGARGHTV